MNKEVLQENNEKLEENNVMLSNVLDTINSLPTAGGGSPVVVEPTEDIYSTSEVKTNKIWIDNKPIYRKVIQFTQGLNGGVNAIAHNVPNVASIVNVSMLLKYNTTIYMNSAFESTTSYISLSGATPDTIYIGIGSSWANSFKQGFTIIMEYTKTTD